MAKHDDYMKELYIQGETLRTPLSPGELKETPDNDKALVDFFTDLSDSLCEQEEDGAERRRQAGHKVYMFYTGQQLTWDNPDTGWTEGLMIPPGQLYWQDDQFSPMVDGVVKEIAKSKPEFNFFSESADIDKSQIARICNAIVHHYQARLLTSEFLEKEAKQAMFYGGSWRYLRWSPDEGAEIDNEEEVEEEEELYPAEDGEEAVTTKVKDKVKKGKRRTGGFVLESVSDDEILVNSASPNMDWVFWLRRDRDLDRAIVRRLHPNARVFTDAEMIDDIEGNRQSRRARHRRGNFGGPNKEISGFNQFANRQNRDVRYTEEWFAPLYYDHYCTMQEEILSDGTKIPADTPLAEVFPTGVKICYVNGEIVGVYEESLQDSWDYVPYKAVPGRFHGKGIEDALPLQEWLNELVSVIMTHAMEAGSPTRAVDGNVFPDNVNIGGVPSQIWRTQNKPIDTPMSAVMAVFPPGEMSQAVYMLVDKIMEHMQSTLGAWSAFGSGAPDAAGKTATGMSLMQEAAQNLMASVLRLRADADRRLMKMIIKLFKENATDEMAFEIGGPYSREKAIRLNKDSLDFDLDISVKEGSYFPRQEYQRRNDLLEYYTAMAQMVEAKTVAQQEVTVDDYRILAERFGVPEAASIPMQAMDAAKRVWDKIEEAAEQIDMENMPPEKQQEVEALVEALAATSPEADEATIIEMALTMMILDAVPIRRYSDYHIPMAKSFRILLNTDEGLELKPHILKAIEARIEEHLTVAQIVEPMYLGGPTPQQLEEQQAMLEQEQAGVEEDKKANKLMGNRQTPPSGSGAGTASPTLPTGRPSQPQQAQARPVTPVGSGGR